MKRDQQQIHFQYILKGTQHNIFWLHIRFD